MLTVPKIAIIIPVYNREHLLTYTLDSIIAQSFTDWECILVDDHSTDASFEVMEGYQKKDARFKAYKRPSELKKGANACRNFGFTKSIAPTIKWFDSDDIMLPKHLEIAYQTIVKSKLDFVATDTLNFNHENGEMLDKPYNFDRKEAIITPENFAKNQIGWITDDFLGKREFLEKIKFNENITTDGDEYNFFVRFLHHTNNGVFINMILTHRRIHKNSIIYLNCENTKNYSFKVVNVKYQTAQDLVVYNNVELIRWFLSGYMQLAFSMVRENITIPFCKPAFKLVWQYYSFIKACSFILALLGSKYFNKGYSILKYAQT